MTTVPVQSRIGLNELATLLRHYKDLGYPSRMLTQSALIREAVNDYIEHLSSTDNLVRSTDVEQSFCLLEEAGLISKRRISNKTLRDVAEQSVNNDKDAMIPDKDIFLKGIKEKLGDV